MGYILMVMLCGKKSKKFKPFTQAGNRAMKAMGYKKKKKAKKRYY